VGDPTIVRWTGPRHHDRGTAPWAAPSGATVSPFGAGWLASALAGFALTVAHLCRRAATLSTGYTTPRAEEP